MNNDEMAEELAGFNMRRAHTYSRSDELIACLESEIAKRDARIVELKQDLAYFPSTVRSLAGDVTDREIEISKLRAELAAIKAQEPVARLPACPSRAFAVANLRDLAQSVLQHDPDVGIFRDEDQAYLINELADLAEAFNGDVKLYAAPVSEANAHGVDDAQRLLDWNRAQPEPRPIVIGREYQVAEACARLNAALSAGKEGE